MSIEEDNLPGNEPSNYSTQKAFGRLRYVYLMVYFTVMRNDSNLASDWLQGPYLYKLYQSYGYSILEIAYLFMTGFVSGAIAGTALGGVADTWGRRRMCLIFCLTSSISLVARMSTTFSFLMLSHILSGLSAGLLYSVFETWLVAEYQSRSLPQSLLDSIFATATFGNGCCAIFAGILANFLVDWFGIRAPFMAAIILLATAATTISSLWTENYGESTEKINRSLVETIKSSMKVLFNDSKILSLGLAQTLFECSMYIFVLLYTPALEQALEDQRIPLDAIVPLGYLFSTLMVAVMIGSLMFRVLTEPSDGSGWMKKYMPLSKGVIVTLALAIAAGAFWTMVLWTNNPKCLVAAFHVFEFTVGVYFPTMSSLKAEIIPDESRAGVMSLLRVPMNIGVCAILWQTRSNYSPPLFQSGNIDMRILFYTALLLPLPAFALMDGLSATPPMGWNTWNKYGCNIQDKLVRETADVMVEKGWYLDKQQRICHWQFSKHNHRHLFLFFSISLGFLKAGYKYLNLDDCWQSENRDYNGSIIVDRYSFPHGISVVADYVHSKGRMASLGHEAADANDYASWTVDYLKYDNCNFRDGISGKERYKRMGDALKATGRNITFSICNWGSGKALAWHSLACGTRLEHHVTDHYTMIENPWEWANEIGHAFRTHDDIIASWDSVVEILDVHAQVVHYGGPGHWADPDMLEVGNGALTVEESRTHFSLWAAMKAPLILGNDLTNMPEWVYEILTNANAISVNQDPLGLPALRVVHLPGELDIWAGPLSGGSMVVVLVNYRDSRQTISFAPTVLDYFGDHILIEDLWTGKTYEVVDSQWSSSVPPHGCKMLKLTNGTSVPYSEGVDDQNSNDISVSTGIKDVSSTGKVEVLGETIYEAEAIVNSVSGLSRRKGGCAACTSQARVIAIGKVHPLESGSLTFNNITGPGHYKIVLRYMDCLSWSSCGDYWTRRWGLRLRVNDGESTYVWLRKIGNLKDVRQFSMGVYLEKDINSITLDNPEGDGPSMDSIMLIRSSDQSVQKSKGEIWTLGTLSEDPLAGDFWILTGMRYIFDYMLDAAILLSGLSVLGAGAYFTFRCITKKMATLRPTYQQVQSSDETELPTVQFLDSTTNIA
ncbi:hypothetical protein NQZ79_g2826 [Umbelopsis isabellina]|nr:hypothetical protein NQZ79_g2826 [Umbelopsis isabellina]